MPTIDEARLTADNLKQRLDLETLFSDLSSRFIKLPAGEVDREIEDALRRLCEPLAIELAVLWQWSQTAPDVIRPTHVYNAHGSPRPSEPLTAGSVPLGSRASAGGPHRCHLFAGGLSSGGRRRPGELSPVGRRVGPLPPVIGGGGATDRRAGPELPAGGAQLAGRACEAAAAGGAGLHPCARPRAPGAALLEGEARLAASAELAGLAFYEVDYAEGVAHFDDRWRDLCGCSR